MPTYEYRCPEGHTFERFQSMTAAPPEKCDVCGAAPVEIVLFPVAIHYKGSGFYTTDYGKGKSAKADGGSDSKGSETKSTETKSGDSKSSESKPSSSSTSSD